MRYREQIQYALEQMCNKSGYINIRHPFIWEDYVVAYNGSSMMLIHRDEDTTPTEGMPEESKPNVQKVIDPSRIEGEYCSVAWIEQTMADAEEFTILRSKHTPKPFKPVIEACKILGIKTVRIYNDTPTTLVMIAEYGGYPLLFKAAGYADTRNVVPPGCDGSSIACDLEYGKAYYEQRVAEDRRKQEGYDCNNFKLWEVQCIKSAWICVRAETWEEAKELAERSIGYNAFDDSCIEAEGYRESTRYDTDFDEYWDEDGRHELTDEGEEES